MYDLSSTPEPEPLSKLRKGVGKYIVINLVLFALIIICMGMLYSVRETVYYTISTAGVLLLALVTLTYNFSLVFEKERLYDNILGQSGNRFLLMLLASVVFTLGPLMFFIHEHYPLRENAIELLTYFSIASFIVLLSSFGFSWYLRREFPHDELVARALK